uniref:ATP synthase complex subunit 8 n=1 Tax=Quasithosea sythoffi TaxID=2892982 RepID=A0A8K1RFP6_9NEOP|nr:ATP synthase F0 subunit 8 [Thosea sinensis]UEE83689.1 ATP synthase F0 subunit 8 [Thosea sinensis]UEK75804.1 ATP synthase F0 subunit 8 [Quasithosea sythoffi]ULA45466.1 ATP synthase F0 subunit 8 [Thosea sinensis]WCH63199.1 ATP synthase F0 subunit 8 [Thosea sinensis]
MPQMMPINWMISLLFFILIFILFNIFNYYIINLKKNKLNNINKKFFFKNLNWKW